MEKIRHNPPEWYAENQIDVRLDTLVTQFNLERRIAVLVSGQAVEFKKACLATGARARKPQVPGANLGNVLYLRSIVDVLALREMMDHEKDIVIVGGGYLAAEAATLLAQRPKTKLTILHRGRTLWNRMMDPESAEWFTSQFAQKNVKLALGETLNGFEGRTVVKNVQTKSGARISAELVIMAIGCELNLGLVHNTPLAYPTGAPVNELLETDEKGIYAIGDIALYPDKVLGGVRRFEHWEGAMAQGKLAGANMTGKKRIRWERVPHCSGYAMDMRFDFVGDFSKPPARFEIEGDRTKRNFVARYFQPNGLMGILLCNQPEERVELAKTQLRDAPRTKEKEAKI